MLQKMKRLNGGCVNAPSENKVCTAYIAIKNQSDFNEIVSFYPFDLIQLLPASD